MSRIPIEYLSKMGKYEVEIHGVKVTARTADIPALVDKHMPDLLTHLSTEVKPKVVGVDVKRDSNYNEHILVLYASTNCCLIIHLEKMGDNLPPSLLNFFKDPSICFVGLQELPYMSSTCSYNNLAVGVEVGELAARVLYKPDLLQSESGSLAAVARGVGVLYDAPSPETTKATLNAIARPSLVFTYQEVKVVITEAFAHYQIGYNLLSSL